MRQTENRCAANSSNPANDDILNWNYIAPEPASLAPLMLAGIALLRQRRPRG